MAGTASCMARSTDPEPLCQLTHSIKLRINCTRNAPSMPPCSQSTSTQSTPDCANSLEIVAPGIICQPPKAGLFASNSALSLLPDCTVACAPPGATPAPIYDILGILDCTADMFRRSKRGVAVLKKKEFMPVVLLPRKRIGSVVKRNRRGVQGV